MIEDRNDFMSRDISGFKPKYFIIKVGENEKRHSAIPVSGLLALVSHQIRKKQKKEIIDIFS